MTHGGSLHILKHHNQTQLVEINESSAALNQDASYENVTPSNTFIDHRYSKHSKPNLERISLAQPRNEADNEAIRTFQQPAAKASDSSFETRQNYHSAMRMHSGNTDLNRNVNKSSHEMLLINN